LNYGDEKNYFRFLIGDYKTEFAGVAIRNCSLIARRWSDPRRKTVPA